MKRDRRLFAKWIDAHPVVCWRAVVLVVSLTTLWTTTDAVRHLPGLDVATRLTILAGVMALVTGSPTALLSTAAVTIGHKRPGRNYGQERVRRGTR